MTDDLGHSDASREETILERWQRLEASLDALRATKALRVAVRCLEVLAAHPEPIGSEAKRAIQLVLRELEAEVELDGLTDAEYDRSDGHA